MPTILILQTPKSAKANDKLNVYTGLDRKIYFKLPKKSFQGRMLVRPVVIVGAPFKKYFYSKKKALPYYSSRTKHTRMWNASTSLVK